MDEADAGKRRGDLPMWKVCLCLFGPMIVILSLIAFGYLSRAARHEAKYSQKLEAPVDVVDVQYKKKKSSQGNFLVEVAKYKVEFDVPAAGGGTLRAKPDWYVEKNRWFDTVSCMLQVRIDPEDPTDAISEEALSDERFYGFLMAGLAVLFLVISIAWSIADAVKEKAARSRGGKGMMRDAGIF